MFTEKKCSYCGKLFVRIDFSSYRYKIEKNVYCCYTCYQKAKENKNDSRRNRH